MNAEMMSAPGGNTKSLSDAVVAALAKAKANTEPAPNDAAAEGAGHGDTGTPPIVLQEAAEGVAPAAGPIDPGAAVQGEVVSLTEAEARALTDEIRADIAGVGAKIERAYFGRAWTVLGYGTWDDYCDAEFASSFPRLPRPERVAIVCALSDADMSGRSIAAAIGVTEGTVRNDLKSGAQNYAPDLADTAAAPTKPSTVTGADGKTYPAKPAAAKKPRVSVDALYRAMRDNPGLSDDEIKEKFGGSDATLAKARAWVEHEKTAPKDPGKPWVTTTLPPAAKKPTTSKPKPTAPTSGRGKSSITVDMSTTTSTAPPRPSKVLLAEVERMTDEMKSLGAELTAVYQSWCWPKSAGCEVDPRLVPKDRGAGCAAMASIYGSDFKDAAEDIYEVLGDIGAAVDARDEYSGMDREEKREHIAAQEYKCG